MGSEIRRLVLDTDVLIDFLRGKQRAIELISKFLSEDVVLATTVINIFELAWGAYRIGRGQDVENLINAIMGWT